MAERENRTAIFSALMVGILVFVLLFWFVEPEKVLQQIAQANLLLLAAAVGILAIEVVFTSLRVQHCVNHHVSFPLAAYCNSLYIAWLSLLPARLGEIAGIAVFNQKLSMPLGSAIASVIVQRIYDVLILSGLLVVLLSQSFYGGTFGMMIAGTALTLLIVVLMTLPSSLGIAARILLLGRQYRWIKKLTYLLLQARTWYRHQSEPRAILWLTGSTLGKWVANLIAMTVIFSACDVDLSIVMLATVAILMHFLGAIPVQSFGGFGAAEVGLAGILVSLGISADQAVAASLLVRIVSLSFSGLFFVFCYLIIRPIFLSEQLIAR